MPRTRRDVARGEKVGEILTLAESIARERGLRAVSVAEVARSLGLSPNSVYWYFPSRDHLWVGVVERMAAAAFAAKTSEPTSWETEIVRLVDRLEELYPMVVVLQEHGRDSEVLSRSYAGLRDAILGMLSAAIAAHVPGVGDPDAEALGMLSVVVGCYALEVAPRRRAELVATALRRIGS